SACARTGSLSSPRSTSGAASTWGTAATTSRCRTSTILAPGSCSPSTWARARWWDDAHHAALGRSARGRGVLPASSTPDHAAHGRGDALRDPPGAPPEPRRHAERLVRSLETAHQLPRRDRRTPGGGVLQGGAHLDL